MKHASRRVRDKTVFTGIPVVAKEEPKVIFTRGPLSKITEHGGGSLKRAQQEYRQECHTFENTTTKETFSCKKIAAGHFLKSQ